MPLSRAEGRGSRGAGMLPWGASPPRWSGRSPGVLPAGGQRFETCAPHRGERPLLSMKNVLLVFIRHVCSVPHPGFLCRTPHAPATHVSPSPLSPRRVITDKPLWLTFRPFQGLLASVLQVGACCVSSRNMEPVVGGRGWYLRLPHWPSSPRSPIPGAASFLVGPRAPAPGHCDFPTPILLGHP